MWREWRPKRPRWPSTVTLSPLPLTAYVNLPYCHGAPRRRPVCYEQCCLSIVMPPLASIKVVSQSPELGERTVNRRVRTTWSTELSISTWACALSRGSYSVLFQLWFFNYSSVKVVHFQIFQLQLQFQLTANRFFSMSFSFKIFQFQLLISIIWNQFTAKITKSSTSLVKHIHHSDAPL